MEEYKERINTIKSLYHYLNLSFKQAEKVYQLEQEETNFHSTEYYFSDWEIFDYRLDNFQKILDEKQFKKCAAHHNKIIKAHETSLIESDINALQNIEYYMALIDFYEHQYIPDFYKEKLLLDMVENSHKSKVSFLKQEYKRFLNNEKVRLLSSHYRNNKLFMPNKLKADLLGHKLLHIVPNFTFFKNKMDEPTKVVAEFLLYNFQYLPDKYSSFFERKRKELEEFVQQIQLKYFEKIKGAVIILNEKDQRAKENKIMQLVLLDKEKYSFSN